VSVVIPVYNGLPYLVEAVDSVLTQTFSDLELVLVDGGSTDGSREWIHTLTDSRVRALKMPEGTTAAGNWTAACEAATGDFVKLLCQDDVLYPDCLTQQLHDLSTSSTAGMSVAQRDIIDARSQVLFRSRGLVGLRDGVVSGRDAILASYRHGTNIFGEPVSILFRSSALEKALPWDEKRPFILDLQLYERVMHAGPIVVRKAPVGAFRVNGGSWSTRLVATQTDQLRSWQGEVEASLRPHILDRLVARFELHRQAVLRRMAYRLVRFKGAFDR
jgi:glycosyltransferase involved in cell wall biosynthesis